MTGNSRAAPIPQEAASALATDATGSSNPSEMGVMSKVAARIREQGMFTFVRWNWIFVAPPLTITKEQLEEGLSIISDAISLADAEVTK